MTPTPELIVGGLQRWSTVDWPGQLAATVFAQGCPWDCPYCHNPELLPFGEGELAWEDVRAFLESRRGLLDGVVFSGGEPTAQAALADAIADVRTLGFGVALHTNGAFPDRLEALSPQLDWVGLDVKAPFDEYERITGVAGSGERARASLRALVRSGVPLQVRTTVHPALLDDAALERLRADLDAEGATDRVLQEFRAEGVRPGRIAETR